MSDEQDKSNIVKLHPNQCNIDEVRGLSEEKKNNILILRRDEMLEFLDGIRGRVMAMDIRAICCLAIAAEPSNDITFTSDAAGVELARTIGCLEFLKHDLIQERLEMGFEEE